MAIVQLSDVFKRELWTEEFLNENDELLNIINSGILIQDGRLQALVNANDSGATFEIPYIQEAVYTEPNVMNDNPSDIIPFDNIGKDKMFAMLGQYAKGWQEADLVPTLSSGIDPILALQTLIAKYWGTDLQRRIISTAKGLLASDIAGSSDITLDVGIVTPSATSIMTRSNVIDVMALRGDMGTLTLSDIMYVNTKQYSDIQKADEISFIKPSTNSISVASAYGMRIVVNDSIPTSGNKQTAIIVKSGAFAFAQKNQVIPVELVREATQGNGGAVTQLIARRGQLIHPNGWSFDSSTVSGISPTLAELENASAWTRKHSVKKSQILFLTTN